MSLNDIGKDIWSIISSYLCLMDFKSLRLTNKDIQSKLQERYFSTCIFYIHKIPSFENICKIKKIIITGYREYERVNQSKASFTHLFLGLDFNCPIEVPFGVTHLDLGYLFNRPIVVPPSVVHLDMGTRFNQIIVIPPSMIYLAMSDYFDSPINIPLGVRYLYMGYWFNQPIILPPSVTHLMFGRNFSQSVTLPPNLQYFKGPERWEKIIPTNIKADYF